jgi:signal transduction histidine kinase
MKKDLSFLIKALIAAMLLVSVAFSATMLYKYNTLAKELFLQQHGVRLTGAVQAMLEEAHSLVLSAYLQNKRELLDDSCAMLEASIGIVRGGDIPVDSYTAAAADKIEIMVADIERLNSSPNPFGIDANSTINKISTEKREIASLLEKFEIGRWGIVTGGHAQLIGKLDYINFALLSMNLILGVLVAALWYSDKQKERAKKEILALNKNLKEAIEQKTAKLKAASESKSIFLSNISHDIKTPLNSIIGYSTLLLEESASDEKRKKKLEAILSSANYILELSLDMMDISRIESGKIKLYHEKFNLEELKTNINALFSNIADEKRVTLTVSTDTKEDAAAYGDKQKILRILYNLTANAIKFTPIGGFVEVKIKDSGENMYAFEIKDSGGGIAHEYQERIFEPFFQIAPSGGCNGNGLGLFIVKSYLEAMGSKIELESSAGRGSIFSFYLSLEPAPWSPTLKNEKEAVSPVSSYKDEPKLEKALKDSILESARLGHASILKQNIANIASEPLRDRLLYFAQHFDMAAIAKEIEIFEQDGVERI